MFITMLFNDEVHTYDEVKDITRTYSYFRLTIIYDKFEDSANCQNMRESRKIIIVIYRESVKGELNPKIDSSLFGHLGIVEQLYEVFLSC